MKKIILLALLLGTGIGTAVIAAAKDKGETAHPTSQKRFTFE